MILSSDTCFTAESGLSFTVKTRHLGDSETIVSRLTHVTRVQGDTIPVFGIYQHFVPLSQSSNSSISISSGVYINAKTRYTVVHICSRHQSPQYSTLLHQLQREFDITHWYSLGPSLQENTELPLRHIEALAT
jgi:hypothetical protein